MALSITATPVPAPVYKLDDSERAHALTFKGQIVNPAHGHLHGIQAMVRAFPTQDPWQKITYRFEPFATETPTAIATGPVDALGKFQLQHTVHAEYPLHVGIVDVQTSCGLYGVASAAASSILDYSVFEFQVVLRETATLRGTVRNQMGQPIAGAKVALDAENPPGTPVDVRNHRTVTAADGTYEMSHVLEGVPYRLRVAHAGHITSEQRIEKNGHMDVSLAKAEAKVSGRVFDILSQKGLPNVDGFFMARHSNGYWFLHNPPYAIKFTSDHEGNFTAGGFAPGEYLVMNLSNRMLPLSAAALTANDFTRPAPEFVVTVPPTGDLTGITIGVVSSLNIKGQVTETAGNPLAGVEIGTRPNSTSSSQNRPTLDNQPQSQPHK